MTAAKASDALATQGEAGRFLPAALSTGVDMTVAEILRENLGGDPISAADLERVKVPAGGALYWTVSSPENPGGAPAQVFRGIIVHHRIARTFWRNPLGEGGGASTPPDCFSDDGLVGIGDPGGPCGDPNAEVCCPYNAWNSDPKGGRGKACKTARLLFVVSPDSFLPRVLVVPPTSLKPVKAYMTRLSSVGKIFWGVVTEFRLEKAKNSTGIEFGRIVPTMGETIPPDQVGVVRQYAEQLRPIFAQVRVDRAEVGAEGSD